MSPSVAPGIFHEYEYGEFNLNENSPKQTRHVFWEITQQFDIIYIYSVKMIG